MKIRKFQTGGTAPATDPNAAATGAEVASAEAAAGTEGQDPIIALYQSAQQAIASNDCAVAMSVLQGFVAFIEQAMSAQQQAAPAPTPVYRKGGKLHGYIVKK